MASFNPYKQWLEISYQGTVPSYYEMIGIDESETDGQLIKAAANRALARVRGHRPGDQAAIWTGLLDQLSQAAACLADPNMRADYDQLLVDGAVPHKDLAQPSAEFDSLDDMPSPLPAELPPVAAEVATVDVAADDDPFAPSHLGSNESAAEPVAESIDSADAIPEVDDSSLSESMASERSERGSQMIIMVAASAAMIAVLLGVVMVLSMGDDTPSADNPDNKGTEQVASNDKGTAQPSGPGERVPRPSPAPMPAPVTTPSPAPVPIPTTPTPVPVPVPTPSPVPPPTPTPPPPPVPEAPKPLTDKEKTELTAAFAEVWVGLGERNFQYIAEHMKVAGGLARTDELAAVHDRLNLLVQYTQAFDRLLNQSLDEMSAGSELKIGTSTIAAVVEVTPEQISVRVAGQLKNFLRTEMSKGLILGIAQTKFDMTKPGSVIAVGTYLVTRKGSTAADREKAREIWQQAAGMGAETDYLLKLLDDNYDLADKPDEAP
jgi:hypothetical protein